MNYVSSHLILYSSFSAICICTSISSSLTNWTKYNFQLRSGFQKHEKKVYAQNFTEFYNIGEKNFPSPKSLYDAVSGFSAAEKNKLEKLIRILRDHN